MQVTKEEKEDDLPSNEEDKLAQRGEEARGKRAGHTAQKGNHLKWAASKFGLKQITKALRRPVLVSISPEVMRASIVPDSEEFSSCFVTRLSLATLAIMSSILLSSKTPDQLIEIKPSLLPPAPSVDWPSLIKSCATSEKQLICSCPRPASYLTCTSPNFPFFSSCIVLDWICNQNKLKLAVKSWFTAGPCSWRQVRVVEPVQTLHPLFNYC